MGIITSGSWPDNMSDFG